MATIFWAGQSEDALVAYLLDSWSDKRYEKTANKYRIPDIVSE